MKKSLLLFALLISLTGFSQTNRQKIQSRLNADMLKLGQTSTDIADWFVQSETTSKDSKITNYYVVQRYQGIEIFNSQSTFVIKDEKVLGVGNRFVKNINKKVNSSSHSLSVIDAVSKVYSQLGIITPTNFSINETISNNSYKLSDGIQKDLISATLVYQPTADDKLILAWSFQFYSPDGKHLWSIRIDANNGKILSKEDLVVSCNFGNNNQTIYPRNYPFSFKEKSLLTNSVEMPLEVNAGSYRVIPYNYESPNHSPFQLISSPSNATASPNGWHDANSRTGTLAALKYTYTRGNNVYVQEDADGNNGTGISPDGGSALNFNFPYAGPTALPTEYTSAASANLFYMNNIMHDVWYQYGFTEGTGNFQKDNYFNGGENSTTGDYVLADSQDGYSQAEPTLNNANFATPIDGTSPRMQMYLWNRNAPPTEYIQVISPSTIAGPKVATTNVFEGTDRIAVPKAPNGITSNLVLYQNNPIPPGYNSACQTPTNAAALLGKIVLIKRGGCLFNLKVKNAQLAGAKAVIVMDSIANNPVRLSMSSTGLLGITIPAVFVTKEIGDSFISEMANGPVNVKLESPSNLYLYADGDFDNGVIAHEYAHGISNRLTGGRLNTNCLTSPEQMGEGWSDWITLMMQLKSGDSGASARGIATFGMNQPITGAGIRNYPYSTNMAINPLTFKDTNGKTYIDTTNDLDIVKVSPHDTGEVWASMLWDLTWAYIAKYGFSSDIYSGTGGNNKVMKLVLDGMRFQNCNPSYIEARDAIILADQFATGGQDYCMIWKVFARRGLGKNASSGSNSGNNTNIAAINDQVEDFTEPSPGPNCVSLAVNQFINEDRISIYPNPAPKGQINIRIKDYIGKINVQVVDLNGKLIYKSNDPSFNTEKSINLNSLQKGIYIIRVNNDSINFSEKLIIN